MTTLTWIVAINLLGGAASVGCAGLFALTARATWVPVLVSYAVGTLLGAVFIETIPHAFELAGDARATAITVMIGILFFFLLEKLVLWRHHHAHQDGASGHHLSDGHDHGRSGLMIIVGDTVHNFVDGVLIAAAFVADFRLGVVTGLAIIAHEIPQEVGDFLILLNSGYSKRRAFVLNLVSSLATVIGGIVGYFALQAAQGWVPTLLALAAASMIYVAVADLIPGLHKRPELGATLQQIALIAMGIVSVLVIDALLRRLGASV